MAPQKIIEALDLPVDTPEERADRALKNAADQALLTAPSRADFRRDELTRSTAEYARLDRMFSAGDFTAAFPEEARTMAQKMFDAAPDPETEKKRYSLACFFAGNTPENTPFLYDNMDLLLRETFGKETSVDEAFGEVAKIVARRKEASMLRDLRHAWRA